VSIIRGATREWNITSPIRINKGTGSRVKLATEAKRLWVRCIRPISPPQKRSAPATLIIRKQKATGNPVAIKSIRLPKMIRSINCHSNGVHLTV